jgi:hypothetical protein
MSDYPSGDTSYDEDRANTRREDIARAVPVEDGDAAFLYLTNHRGIAADAVRGCPDLRLLKPPIAGRDCTDHACVSLLRPAPDAEPTGAELAFVDALGHPSATDPRRVQWSFVENGCKTGWFFAGGAGDTAVVAEGYGPKPLAVVAADADGLVLGWGARSWLRHKRRLPGVKKMVIVPDRRPDDSELSQDGKPLAPMHDRDYQRAIDHWMLEGLDVYVAPDPPDGLKDADEVLKALGPEALRALVAAATRAELSAEGWCIKLARMDEIEYERNRDRFGSELGVRLATLDGMRRKGAKGVSGDEEEDDAVRSRLVAIALEADLFQDDGGDGYACVTLGAGAQRTFRIESSAFVDWLVTVYGSRFPVTVAGRQVPGSVSASTLNDATRTILAVARQGEMRPVFLRLGWSGRDRLYLDMATPEPRAIEITPEGWAIVAAAPVHLVHSATAKPLPVPDPGPREEVLKSLEYFLGFPRKDDRFVLLIGMMMAGLMPRGPYPILILSGEQGSGKTNRSRFIKLVIDPVKANVRGRPRSAEDLAISVWRSWIPSFDNLSKLDQDMSDWLCRLSEGAGLPKRKLYSDTEEVLIEAARPIVLTAIPDIAQSGDVLDRAALVRCEQLQVKVREQVLLDQFEAFRPQLLCYLLEAASCALRRFPEMVDTHDGLRRGDWCAWVEAAAPALGFEGDAFTEAYRTNQTQAVRAALELDTVSAALLKFMERERSFEGTITSLHSTLEPIARKQHSGRLPLDWPSMSHHFSGRLRRLAPMLRRVKVEVEQRHGMAGSLVRVVNKEGMSPHAAAREPRTGSVISVISVISCWG